MIKIIIYILIFILIIKIVKSIIEALFSLLLFLVGLAILCVCGYLIISNIGIIVAFILKIMPILLVSALIVFVKKFIEFRKRIAEENRKRKICDKIFYYMNDLGMADINQIASLVKENREVIVEQLQELCWQQKLEKIDLSEVIVFKLKSMDQGKQYSNYQKKEIKLS